MPGHFVMWKISRDIWATYQALAGVTIQPPLATPPAHAQGVANGAGGVFPGWTVQSSAELGTARGGHQLGNRNNLPPHRYLSLPAGAPAAGLAAQLLADKYGWITELERPRGFGLTNLAGAPNAAQASWNSGASGYKYDALLAQMLFGPVSIEVYYLGSKQMT